MGMDMKKADGSIDNEIRRKEMSDAFQDVDNILTYNVINENEALIILDVGVFQSLEKWKVGIFLLLAFK